MFRVYFLVIFLSLFTVSNLSADERNIAYVSLHSDSLSIEGNNGFTNFTFSIVGPNEFYFQKNYADNHMEISNGDLDIASLEDGLYTYQITAALNEKNKHYVDRKNNGRKRDSNQSPLLAAESQSGSFTIADGQIVVARENNNRRAKSFAGDFDEDE
ncbi:MAG: hypothetical protein GQ532_07185 [Methylomarinum sp.]|nr:hypothetical protein [Methylomarinum sp.]